MPLLTRWILALILLAPLGAGAAVVDDIKALLARGQAAQAYALGAAHPEQFGEPSFDFYYGIAAIDGGHAVEGVFALERYLLRFPDNQQARLEVARGYFLIGDYPRARDEFEAVLAGKPPAGVVDTVKPYLAAIRARESRYKRTLSGYVEAGGGFDTNVNGGAPEQRLNLPNFGTVLLNSAGVESSNPFMDLGFGGSISEPVAPDVSVFAAGSANGRVHRNQRDFDQRVYGAAVGVSIGSERDLLRFTASHSMQDVGRDRYRNVSGLSGLWRHQLDELTAVTAGGQLARLNFAGANDVRDANFHGMTLGVERAFVRRFSPVLSLDVNAGRERVTAPSRDDLSRYIYGARVALRVQPAPKWTTSAGVTWQRSVYEEVDPLFSVTRNETYLAGDVTATYQFDEALSVSGEFLVVRNRSNNPLYEYDREMLGVKLRYTLQ